MTVKLVSRCIPLHTLAWCLDSDNRMLVHDCWMSLCYIQAERYSSAEEVAKQRAEAAATEERRRRGAADDAFDRALKHMMGGSLVRATDEVADLAAARPAWMNGNPQVSAQQQILTPCVLQWTLNVEDCFRLRCRHLGHLEKASVLTTAELYFLRVCLFRNWSLCSMYA